MKFISHFVVFLSGVCITFFFLANRLNFIRQDQAQMELLHAKAAIVRRIDDESRRITSQLSEFSHVLSNNRDFAMKLIVDGDRAAPEVSEKTQEYMGAMGFSLLEIADSSFNLLSCGHFPAAAGNSIEGKASLLDSAPQFLFDNIKGVRRLTFQAKCVFSIADIPFICMGGSIVDSLFLARLQLFDDTRVLLRNKTLTAGIEEITSISDIENNRIIINDVPYRATSFALPFVNDGDSLSLIVLMNPPGSLSLMSLLWR